MKKILLVLSLVFAAGQAYCENPIQVIITMENPSEAGQSDGTMPATALNKSDNNDTPSIFSYEWNNGEASETLVGLSAGTYTVTVTDQKGQTQELSGELIDQ